MCGWLRTLRNFVQCHFELLEVQVSDNLMAFDNVVDAERVLTVLGKRLARFGLTLHPDKTRFVDFHPKRLQGVRHPQADGTAFDFLGLTHVWGRSRNGKDMVRQVTAKSRFARQEGQIFGKLHF